MLGTAFTIVRGLSLPSYQVSPKIKIQSAAFQAGGFVSAALPFTPMPTIRYPTRGFGNLYRSWLSDLPRSKANVNEFPVAEGNAKLETKSAVGAAEISPVRERWER
jgi:hypothetical protein